MQEYQKRLSMKQARNAQNAAAASFVKKKTKKAVYFYGCKEYPNCDFVSWDEPSMEKCPQCGKTLLKKKKVKTKIILYYTPDCGYEKVEGRMSITVIGAGLAGCEAAWQIASKRREQLCYMK